MIETGRRLLPALKLPVSLGGHIPGAQKSAVKDRNDPLSTISDFSDFRLFLTNGDYVRAVEECLVQRVLDQIGDSEWAECVIERVSFSRDHEIDFKFSSRPVVALTNSSGIIADRR
jgi:hypothetical protein